VARARQTKRRKHRGTQAGTVRPRGRRSARPRSRVDARASAETRRQERLNRPPTWRVAIQRGAIAAAALFALLVVAFKASVGAALPLAVLAALLYIPAFHATDSLLYRTRMRRRERERERAREAAD
jgi:ABC-type transport system involved in cytochrome bd biosynthesis fused ATPase/permease subunit